jgi:putative endonuclease
MHYVYLIRSIIHQDQLYIGSTRNVVERLKEHNSGKSSHTNKYKPWKILAYVALSDKECAIAFERYLKTSSGKAFALKRFLPGSLS